MAQEEVKITFTIDGIEKQVNSVEELQKEMAKLGKESKKTKENLEDAGNGGGLMSKGLSKIGSIGKAAFKGIGTAIKASGIGLLVGIVAKLVEQFTKTDTGAKILSGSMAVLGVIFEQIEKAVSWLIDNLVDAFTNPQDAVEKLRAGVEALKGWFSSLGDYIKNNFILLFQKMRQEILEARIAWNNFTGDAEEADKLTKELETLQEEMNNTREAIEEAGDAVAEPFIAAGQAIMQVVDDIVEGSKAAIAASNAAIDAAASFAALQNRLIVENAELTKQVEEQKKISEDTTRSYEERKAALDKVNEANEQLAQNALIEAQALEDKVRLQLSIASNDEDRRELEAELAAATAERIAREQEAQIVRLESAQLNRELDQEELDRKQSINDIIADLNQQNIENEYEAAQAALDLAEQQTLKELELLRGTEEEKQAIIEGFAAQRAKLAEDEAKRQQMLDQEVKDAKVAIAKQGLEAVSALVAAFAGEDEKSAKRAFNVQKALSLASATISGTEAVINAYKTAQASPITAVFPGYPAVQAGLAGAFAAAQIATIARSKFQSAAQPAADTAATGAGGINPGGITYNLGAGGGGEDVTLNNGQQEPLKAYVVATEVTSAQQANAQIDNLSKL